MTLAVDGGNLAIEALAGTGKTSTLRLIAEAKSNQRCQFVAFNRKIVDDARGSFPDNVNCSTAHSLAMKAVGRDFRHRLNDRFQKWTLVADKLGLDPDTPMVFDRDDDTFELHAGRIAAIAYRTVDGFCTSADDEISARHVPFQVGLDPAGGPYDNRDRLAAKVVPLARQIWADVSSVDGHRFRFAHNHYLKVWQLSEPVIPADVILFDESQDANPLMMSIVEQQAERCQLIWVGDSQQQIYGWNGALNALERVEVDNRTYLTTSFRFGPEVAEAANLVLARLNSPKRLTGAGKPGSVGPLEGAPDAILCRTNGLVMATALDLMETGQRVAVQGGVDQVLRFARAAADLMEGKRTDHPELACFANWPQVQDYIAAEGEDARELAVLARMVEDHGVDYLTGALRCFVDPEKTSGYDVVVSTAHKSKGAEWDLVRLADDFPVENPSDEELRLLYVAATRARRHLDAESADLAGRYSLARILAEG